MIWKMHSVACSPTMLVAVTEIWWKKTHFLFVNFDKNPLVRGAMTFSITTFSIMTLGIKGFL
jgi:hypothetical protein